MSSIWRRECTRRLRADDLLAKIPGGGSQIIAAEFWEVDAAPPVSGTGEEDCQIRDEVVVGVLLFAGIGDEDGWSRDETIFGKQLFAAIGSEDGQCREELANGELIFAGTGAQESQPRDESGEAYQISLIFGEAMEERQPSEENGVAFHDLIIIGFAEQWQEPHYEDGIGWIKGAPQYGSSKILALVKADSLIMSTFLSRSILTTGVRAETPMKVVHG